MSDKCRDLRENYEKCFQEWLDSDFFKGKAKGPMVPCREELDNYHKCLSSDPKKAHFLTDLDKYKEQVKPPFK